MIYLDKGSHNTIISSHELKKLIFQSLDKMGERKRVLIIPPDITRIHSKAGEITKYIYQYYGKNLKHILPALGTHSPMNKKQLEYMFPDVPIGLFLVHDWRNDTIQIGKVPSEYVKDVSNGLADFDWPVQVNKKIIYGDYDLIISVGQVVPHEVIGMANYNKNIFVGTGGVDSINYSHYLGACIGMENIMGRADNPVRAVMNYASEHILNNLSLLYIHSVIGNIDKNRNQLCGIYAGNDIECFIKASELSEELNVKVVDKALDKVIVYLNPDEYKSTWLGNKSIYRTRMALADNAELIIIAPGIGEFGEDKEIDRLIRKYHYSGNEEIKKAVADNEELRNNLSAAAHLIHGSSEGRFNIVYCPGKLSKHEIESVGYNFADIKEMQKKYNLEKLNNGFNNLPDGEKIYFISNPATGLWKI